MQRVQLRIIGGKFRGRKFVAEIGIETRPTSDRVRESVFNVLQHQLSLLNKTFNNYHALDAFAGTGSYGFEALSRGCQKVSFIDHSRVSLMAIQHLAQHLGVIDNITLIHTDLLKIKDSLISYDLIFVDPPYELWPENLFLQNMLHGGYIADQAIIVCELGPKINIAFKPQFKILKSIKFNHCQIVILRYENKS